MPLPTRNSAGLPSPASSTAPSPIWKVHHDHPELLLGHRRRTHPRQPSLSRLRTRGLDITLLGRTKEQITDPELARAFAQAATRSDAVVLSFHGGTTSCPAWPALVEAWKKNRRESGLPLPWIHIQPTSGDDDGLLAAQDWASGLDDGTWRGLIGLLEMGGPDNVEAALRILVDRVRGGSAPIPDVIPAPTEGIWHPRHGLFTNLAEYRHHLDPDLPTVGITFPRSYWLEHNTAHIEALVEAIEGLDANTVPFFCLRLPDARRGNPGMAQTLETLLRDEDGNRVIDTLIDVHGMSMTAGVPANADAYPKLGVSVLHALTSYALFAAWETQGMGAMDVATQAAQPEFDGASSLNSWLPERSIGSTISPEPSYHTWSLSPADPKRWPNWPFRGPGWPVPPPTNAKWRSSSTTIRRVMTGSLRHRAGHL